MPLYQSGRAHQGILKLLEFLYPPVCPFCQKVTDDSTGICAACRAGLPYIEEPRCMKCGKPVRDEEQEYCRDCGGRTPAYEQGRSLWLHVRPVTDAVYQFKFHNKRYYAEIFAEEMVRRYGAWIRDRKVEEILPVPLYSGRRRERGFNQAELLAKGVGRRMGIPVNTEAVFRIRSTRPQKELDDRERIRNLQGAFGVSRHWKPAKCVLLIDDIYTTGNTIHRISKVLKKAGAQKVYFLTISIGQGL